MRDAQTIFEGLHDQIQKSRDLFELRKLRDAIVSASNQGRSQITWDKSVLDEDVIYTLLSEGIVVNRSMTKPRNYVLDWSEIYEEM